MCMLGTFLLLPISECGKTNYPKMHKIETNILFYCSDLDEVTHLRLF